MNLKRLNIPAPAKSTLMNPVSAAVEYDALMFCGYRHLIVDHGKRFAIGKVYITGIEAYGEIHITFFMEP
jgi:hypothetical protein